MLQTKMLKRRNSRRSWAYPSKVTSAINGSVNQRYHGSWQNIDKGCHPKSEGVDADEDEDEDTEEEEGQFDEDAEDATTPVADQQLTLLGNQPIPN